MSDLGYLADDVEMCENFHRNVLREELKRARTKVDHILVTLDRGKSDVMHDIRGATRVLSEALQSAACMSMAHQMLDSVQERRRKADA